MELKTGYLETEKEDLLKIAVSFVNNIIFEKNDYVGRPRADYRDIIISLLIMSYHSFSYRRANTDIRELYSGGLISAIPSRQVLNKYMLSDEFRELLQSLITFTAMPLIDLQDTIIIDSTWFSKYVRMSSANFKRDSKRNIRVPPLSKTRKLHIIAGLNNRIILTARTSEGTKHDNNFFKLLLDDLVNLGMKIKVLLADSGYNSRDNYALCEEYGIRAFIDFKSNHVMGRPKSFLRKEQLFIYREHPEIWKEFYRFRPIIESVFSSIKRRGKNYLRSRCPTSQDNEMLLKVLWYNLCILSKKQFIDNK